MVDAPSEEIKEPAAPGGGSWTPAIHLEQSRRRRTKSQKKTANSDWPGIGLFRAFRLSCFRDRRRAATNEQSALTLVGRFEPGRQRRLVGADFRWLEVQTDFPRGGFGAVGSVDQIHLAARAVVAADRAGGGLETAGG